MRFRDFHINIKIRIIEEFLSSSVTGMVFPFMAIYLAVHFSASITGLLLIINVIVGVIANFIGGYYSDLIGRKKLMVSGESLRLMAFLVMALSNSPWFDMPILTFLMMTVNSVTWGLAGPAGQAMLIDVSTPEQRKYMFSLTYWATNFSIALGGILGGFLFKSYFFQLLLATAAVELIIVIMIIFIIKESFVPSEEIRKVNKNPMGMLSVYKKVLKDRAFVLFILGNLFIFTMEMHLTNYIGIHLANDMPKQTLFSLAIDGINTLGFLRTENTVIVVLTSLLAVKFISKYKDQSVLLLGSSLFVIGYSLISYTTNIWLLLIFMLVATIGEVTRTPIQQNYLSVIPPEDARSSYMAVNGLVWNGSSFITSVFVTMSAFLAPLWMSIAIFIVGALGVAFYVAVLPQLEERKIKVEKEFKTVS
jgi:MFS transporter, DHA1 family, multidrug resistance protein B